MNDAYSIMLQVIKNDIRMSGIMRFMIEKQETKRLKIYRNY